MNIVNQLKDLRVSADYTGMVIDREKAESAVRMMDEILPLLKKCA